MSLRSIVWMWRSEGRSGAGVAFGGPQNTAAAARLCLGGGGVAPPSAALGQQLDWQLIQHGNDNQRGGGIGLQGGRGGRGAGRGDR